MDKNIVVFGGSSGIGLSLVQQLLDKGYNLSVVSRTGDNLASLGVQHIAADVLTDDLKGLPLPDRIDGLAYCPGSITLKPFRSLKPEQFRSDYEINVIGAVRALQACQRKMKASDSASVVLFSTVAVGQGMPFHSSIAAAKGAVEGLTRSLAAEWAPRIRVNCIAPSLTDTPLAAKLLSSEEKKEASANRHPLRKVGESRDVAALAAFLLSEQANWISGQLIGIDGGMSTLRV
ncbi:MAG: SDR family oxidoreductase [Bacteroidota bacterium]